MVLASGRSISGLGWGIGWLVVHGLLVGAHVVDVVVVFSVAAVLVGPLQLKVEERLNVQPFFTLFNLTLALKVWSFWLRYSSLLCLGLPRL